MKTIQEILDQEYELTPDGETLYSITGNVYHVTYDYHGEEGITDLTLINEYEKED